MFTVTEEKYGTFTKVKLINSQTKEFISIIPEFGCKVNEISLCKNDKLFSILDGDKNSKEVKQNHWFKGAKLLPFPNRINDGKYTHNNSTYILKLNKQDQNHAIHGLIYNKPFKITKIKKTKSNASVSLEYLANDLQGYPFKFQVTITYKLSTNGFECTTSVINKDKVSLPLGDGWHPYFTFKCNVDDLFLKVPSNKKISVNNRMIPTGKKIKVNKFIKINKIGKQNFDTGFILSTKKGMAKTEISNKNSNVTIQIWQETGQNKYNFLQLFIPPSRKSIAVEPMTCETNAFNNKEGLIILNPKEKFNASYGVKLL